MPEKKAKLRLINDLRLAIAFSTRLPLHRRGDEPEDLTGPLLVMPLAGLPVALLTSCLYLLAAALGIPALLSALLAIFSAFLFTGGLHEDGLADFADALGVTGDKEKRLEVMTDSRIGTFGAAALIMSFLLRAGALAEFTSPAAVFGALIASAALSRSYFSLTMALLQPARKEGLAQSLSPQSLPRAFIPLALGLAIALICLGPGAAIFAVFISAIVAAGLLLLAKAKIGGYSGDLLGALQQMLEITLLITFASKGFS